MCGRAGTSGVGQLFDLCPRFVAAELEVEEVQDTCLAGTITHFSGLVGIASERLVAQHRVALLDRTSHVVEMHERR